MCDSLCWLGADRSLFAKNSDRHPSEAQVVEWHPPRPPNPGGLLATTYCQVDEPGAAALLGSRPAWQWGLEHGVNQHGVAIGNEQLWTVDDPTAVPDGLTGLDLVRLGLERARRAEQAVDVMVDLIERYGQGGIADRVEHKAYFSSFLVTDPTEAWILETSGRSWAARPVTRAEGGAALSNRISLSTEWTRASPDVVDAGDFDRWRRAASPTAHAERRLAVTRAAVCGGARPTERRLAQVLRDHGRPADSSAGLPPAVIDRLGTGVSVCLHLTGVQATTASMIVSVPRGVAADDPIRAWVALGSPCVSVFIPVFPFDGVPSPAALAQPATWTRFADLGRRLEAVRSQDAGAADDLLARMSQTWARVEEELWSEADELAGQGPDRRRPWTAMVWPRVQQTLIGLSALAT